LVLLVASIGEAPVWYDPVLYEGRWRSPLAALGFLLVPLPGIRLYAWHIMLLALLPLAFVSGGAFRRGASATYISVAVSFLSLGVTLAWGLVQGGSAWAAYYQLWRFCAALVIAVAVVAVARRPADLRALGRTLVFAAVVRSVLAVYFWVFFGRGQVDPPPVHMTTHEDSMLFVGGVLIALAWALMRRRLATWLTTALVCALITVAIALNNRRLAWVELIVGLVFLYLMLPPRGVRRKLNRFALAVAPIVLLYAVVGWGRAGPLFAPLKALATTGSNTDPSSLARVEENHNLIYTLGTQGNPVLGTGWGRKYAERTSFYTSGLASWALYSVMPHNSLLGLTVFAGLVGLFGVWNVVPVAAYFGASGAARAPNPIDRAAGTAVVAILPAYAAQCYGDIGLQMLTCCLVAGVAIGAAGSIHTREARAGRRAGAGRPDASASPASRAVRPRRVA
jgi:O-antigen ligase